MIRVTVFQDSKQTYRGIAMDGHAGYGEHGYDIICASASVLAINFANSVEQFTDDYFENEIEEDSGYFSFHFVSDISLESKLLMNSLVLGLQAIRESYGSSYIQIDFKEV